MSLFLICMEFKVLITASEIPIFLKDPCNWRLIRLHILSPLMCHFPMWIRYLSPFASLGLGAECNGGGK